jgi:peptide/nickel transport system substrate-binding protein
MDFTRSSRRPGLVAGLGALVLVLAACTGGTGRSSSSSTQNTVTGKPVTGGTVTYAQLPASIPNWIWPMSGLAYFSVYNISNLQQPMYRPLYWFGGHNTQPTIDYGLSVADPPVYAADGKSVQVTMKPWKWSNGEAVNADDVVFWMHMVKAEKDNWAGTSPGAFPDNITAVTKTGEQSLKLTLDAKYSNNWFTYNELSQITPMPMAWDVTHAGAAAGSGGCTKDQSRCPAVYKFLVSQAKDQKSYATSKIWGVVDGPWRLGSYSSSGNYSLVPNKAYSGSPKPRLDEVKFLPFTTDSAEFNVLKSGSTIDLGYIPAQDLPPKPGNAVLPATNPVGAAYYLRPSYGWSVNYFVPNFNNPDLGPAFRQLYVRQALALTLNQPLGVEKAQRGYGYPNFGPVPVRPVSKWLSPAAKQGTPYPFDPGKARSLLTGHGWTEQAGVMTCTRPGTASDQCGPGVQQGTRLSIKYDYASGSQALDQEMQQYKSDAAKAGIELKLKQAPFNSVAGEALPCKPSQAACGWQIANWGGGWIYAPDYLPTGETLFGTGSGANSGSYSDPTMDRLIKATQQDSGTQPLYAFEDYAAKQLPVIYQLNTYAVNAISTHVGGVVFNPLGTLTPEYWYRTK